MLTFYSNSLFIASWYKVDKGALRGGKMAESRAKLSAVLLCFNGWCVAEILVNTVYAY